MMQNPDKIKTQLVELIKNSRSRMTLLAVKKQFLSKHPKVSTKFLTRSLKELVSEGKLAYTYEFGSSFLEPSFEKPVRVSDHVILKPAGTSFPQTKNDIVITLQKGAAFGSGRHPSTRLALKAMEKVLLAENPLPVKHPTALDIGTGSGVLAIAAVLMGIKKAIGIDIDPCARSEAIQNIQLNGCADTIAIDQRASDSIQDTFYLVLANLRFPTLAKIHQHISDITENTGFAVLSGLKTEEVDPVVELYETVKMKKQYLFTEKDWAAIVFKKCSSKK